MLRSLQDQKPSNKVTGVHTFKSLDAFPANSRTSAVRYSVGPTTRQSARGGEQAASSERTHNRNGDGKSGYGYNTTVYNKAWAHGTAVVLGCNRC